MVSLFYIKVSSRPIQRNHCGIVNIRVPAIPHITAAISEQLSLSLITRKAIRPAKTGPHVKLMQLLRLRGIYAMAVNYITLETNPKTDLKTKREIYLESYAKRLKFVPLAHFPYK